MPAPGALDLDEIAVAKILDPSGVEGHHRLALCCWFVLPIGPSLLTDVNQRIGTALRPLVGFQSRAENPNRLNHLAIRLAATRD
jgi:hypothetical protein